MSIRTDLAFEAVQNVEKTKLAGVKSEEFREGEIEILRVSVINEEGKRQTGKELGDYYTLDVGDFKTPAADLKERAAVCSKIISKLIENCKGNVLVACLGNREITPDSLGPVAAKYILATRHIPPKLKESLGFSEVPEVSAITPGTMGQTGIESAEVISSLVKELRPTAVIVVDALASKSVDRLSSTVQISNAGISPGSGVQNRRKELSKRTLGVPVVSVGAPMVVDMATIAEASGGTPTEKEKGMMVTPREIDLAVEHAGKTIGYAINLALIPSVSYEDMVSLTG